VAYRLIELFIDGPWINVGPPCRGDAPSGGVTDSDIEGESGTNSLDTYLVSKTVLQSTA
jgi:acyl-CoA reductase-like NAD-dependent aldehyde dehydrogenase